MAAVRDEKVVPIFTINDFPPEILERFAPDLRPRTVSTLRLVSRRFRDVFSADDYYRCYLYYPYSHELYRSDLEEVGDVEGTWKRVLMAEKKRLKNWRSGEPTRIDIAKFPENLNFECEDLYISWQHKISEQNEHWMLAECRDRKIVLLNVTAEPIFSVVDVSSFTSLSACFSRLGHDQVLIDSGEGSEQVFNIANDGEGPSLEYSFSIEAKGEKGRVISGRSNVMGTYRSLYVSYKDGLEAPVDGILKLWDLKEGVQLDRINLRDLLTPKYDLNLKHLSRLVIVDVEFPYIVIDLIKMDAVRKEVVVVNVEKGRLSLWLEEQYIDIDQGNYVVQIEEKIKGNTLLVEVMEYESSYAPHKIFFAPITTTTVRVYDLSVRSRLDGPSSLLFEYEIEGDVSVFYESLMLTIIKSEYGRPGRTLVQCYDGLEFNPREEITMRYETLQSDSTICIHYSIGPFFVMKRSSCPDHQIKDVLTVDMHGTVMFDWEALLSQRALVGSTRASRQKRKYIILFLSLSKCILLHDKCDEVLIFNF